MIESVIPRSKNNTLAPSFAPSIELGIVPTAVFPDFVWQLKFNPLLARLIIEVLGTATCFDTLVFGRQR